MTSKTRDYIYVYDEESHKIIIIDGETGEKIEQKEDRVTSILSYFKENGEMDKLKKFTIWCAHETNKNLKPIQAKMLDLAEKSIYGEVESGQLELLYQETEGTAIATDTVGLQHGSVNAPAFLASRECVNPDPYQGALQAARFHRLWAELVEKNKREENESNQEYLRQLKNEKTHQTVNDLEQQQVDYLLDLMNN